ncbi:MAG: GFA family protein [Pseudomonadota bacterium]|nr:GFA family protein [Pseudomonadota bacterium]
MQTYQGQCHCGAVRFEVDLDLSHTLQCNCSFCRRKGAVIAFANVEALRVTAGEDQLKLYQFGNKDAQHRFCRTCGIHPFHKPILLHDKVGINVGCLDGVDPFTTSPQLFQGIEL